MSRELGIKTLRLFYQVDSQDNPIIRHAYPTSLRIVNSAKFIVKWDVKESWLYNELLSDLKTLSGSLEYHLLGNHLLENAFALYIGGIVTGQEQFTRKARRLLVRQLREQILNDGMHFERSPMYHLIILERLLDAFNFAKVTNDDLESVLKFYAVKMTALAMNWDSLVRMPMMQDSAYDIALTVPDILEYSKELLNEDYPSKSKVFNESGYRYLNSENFSVFANVGSISPSYQPGHAHADELNFELFYNGRPVIVDTGLSTYEKNDRRFLERSTSSHNCVVSNGNSSDIWSGFRVGKRAKVRILQDNYQKVTAVHDGYRVSTLRTFDCSINGNVFITDEILSNSKVKDIQSIGYLHIHPDVLLSQIDNTTFVLDNKIKLTIEGEQRNILRAEIKEYKYAQGYNNLRTSNVILYPVFHHTLIKICAAN
jgi:uncharacterized heparinase superfamily protein